jgi:hypothetical protein
MKLLNNSMTITVFVGDSDDSIAIRAKKHTADAFLVEHSNFEEFLSSEFSGNVTVYTAHSDLPKITKNRAVLYEVLNKADIIYYSPPVSWSDSDRDFFSETNQQSLTLFFLSIINKQKNNVINFDLSEYTHNPYISLRDSRKTQSELLWSAGCSIAHGVGVSKDQRYANLISNNINRPLIDLSLAGSSIEYAADQILRSDIRANDIVVWGLTEETRFSDWNTKLQQVRYGERNIHSLTETRIYKSVISVHQVVNFCSKVGATLILIPIICSENFCLLLSGLDNFYQMPYQTKFIDYGDDELHPGPLQHKKYADFLISVINNK